MLVHMNAIYQQHPTLDRVYGVCMDCAGTWMDYDDEDSHVCGQPTGLGVATLDQYGFDVGGFLLNGIVGTDIPG